MELKDENFTPLTPIRRTSDILHLSNQNKLQSKLGSISKKRKGRYSSLDINLESVNQKHYLSAKVHRNLASMIYINLDPSNYTIPNYIKILKKDQIKRTIEESSIIKHFIENSNLKKKLKRDGIDESNFDKMAMIYSTYVKYIHFKKNCIIYKNDDPAEMIYIVLTGRILLSVPEQKNVNLTGYDYFCKLMEMKNNNDESLLKKTIRINKTIIKIDYEEFDKIKKVILKIEIQRKGISNLNIEYFETAKINLDELNINFVEMNKNDILDQINIYLHDITVEDCQKYDILYDKKVRKDLVLFYYKDKEDIICGNYFGDCENFKYLEKAFVEEECELCLLNTNIYNEYLHSEGYKIKMKDLNFLYDSFFFSNIVKRKFEREYYPLFSKELLQKGNILFKENSPVKYIYFIRNGNIELTTSKSILENHVFIKYLNNIENENNKHFVKEDSFFPNLINNPSNMVNDLSLKKTRRFFIYDKKEMLSVIPFFYGMNNFFNAIVYSEDAIVFKLSVNHLPLILASEDNKTYNKLEQICDFKLNIIKKRLINMNNINLSIIDNKYEGVEVEDKDNIKEIKNSISKKTIVSNSIDLEKNKILLSDSNLHHRNSNNYISFHSHNHYNNNYSNSNINSKNKNNMNDSNKYFNTTIRTIKAINLQNIILKDKMNKNNINKNIFENIFKKKTEKKVNNINHKSYKSLTIPKIITYEDRLYKEIKKNISNNHLLKDLEFASNSPTRIEETTSEKTKYNLKESKNVSSFLTSLYHNHSNFRITQFGNNNNITQSNKFFNDTLKTIHSYQKDINNKSNLNSFSLSNIGTYKSPITKKKLEKYKVIDEGEFPNYNNYYILNQKKNTWKKQLKNYNQYQCLSEPKETGYVFRNQYKLTKRNIKMINDKKIVYKRFKEKLNQKNNDL